MNGNPEQDDNTHTHPVLTKGTMVGHYRIVERIGAGGMGEVYLAQDTKLNRKVALKFLSPHLCQDEGCRKRFTREAQAAAGLDHPNIAGIHEVGEYSGRPFYSMQVVEGQSLREVVAGKDLPIGRILEIAIQVCEGLHAAHDKGIIHRDIKPSNILLDGHGRVRIVDFGLASIHGSEHLTKTGSTLGTIGYMSPEQVEGKSLDHRSDLFSFGLILYELIAGRAPFKGENDAATLYLITHESPQPLARYRSDIPDSLQMVVDKAIEKNRERRYQTAAGIISDLKRLESGTSTARAQSSVAVLPFTNLSADPEQEYFCDGMTDEIINVLAHIEDLRVIARTSSFTFKGQNKDVRDIGRILDVQTLLEGSIQKVGNRLRITAQLVKVADGSHLWSARYDRDIEDVFAIQDEISRAIAVNLNAKLAGRQSALSTKRHADDLDAYGLYLRGRWLFDRRTESAIRESIDCYKDAIDRDPDYALAYAELAYSYCELPQFSSFPQKDALAKAREAAESALAIDDTLSEAHTALGVVLSEFDWDWAKAQTAYGRAIELNAASASTRFWNALLLLYLGQTGEAMRQMRIAQELDPLSLAVNKYLGLIYLCAEQYDAAETTLRNTIAMDPGMTFLHPLLGLVHIKKGQYAEALRELEKEEETTEKLPSIIKAWQCFPLIAQGCRSDVQDILEYLKEEYRHNRASPYSVAVAYFAQGDLDDGFVWLNKAYQERDYWLRYLKVDPMAEGWRDDPRYKRLLRQIGLE